MNVFVKLKRKLFVSFDIRHARKSLSLLSIILISNFVACASHEGLKQPAAKVVETVKEAESPIKTSASFISDWRVLGPFQSAPQEASLDYLQLGSETTGWRSAYAKEAKIFWQDLKANDPHIRFEFKNVDWPYLQKSLGALGLNAISYFKGSIEASADKIILVKTKFVREFFVNGVQYFGQKYGYDYHQIPVALKKGSNEIILKVASYGDPEFEFSHSESAGALTLLDDLTVPDLVRGELLNEVWMGIPVANTSNEWQSTSKILISTKEGVNLFDGLLPQKIAPLSVLKFPIRLSALNPQKDEPLALFIQILNSENKKISEKEIILDVVKADQPRSITLRSQYDYSVQSFSVLPPKNFDSKKRYAAILALHGANVSSYVAIKTYAPKDGAYVVAPSNRRPHGFAWQDVGRLDALEVLNKAIATFPINSKEIYLAGHSMGGQGVWHIGLHHPQLFSGLSPAAGWMNYQTYSSTAFQKSGFVSTPELNSIRDRISAESNNPFFIENANELPIFITQADKDEVVSSIHSRKFLELAESVGLKVKYREIDSNQHWCADPKSEGVGFNCVDHPDQYEFLRTQRPKDSDPKAFSYQFYDLGLNDEIYWVKILEQEKPFSLTTLKVSLGESSLQIESKNIRAMTLNLSSLMVGREKVNIIWNGKTISKPIPDSRQITLGNLLEKKLKKSHAVYGPLKSLFTSPYLIVYGTLGSKEETEVLLHQARLLSLQAWDNANAFAPIVADRELKAELQKNYNLVLLGGPTRNSLVKDLNSRMPIRIEKNRVIGLGDSTDLKQSDLAAAFVYPNPSNPKTLVGIFEGTSSKAEELFSQFSPISERFGAGSPDFIVFNSDVLQKAWGGVVAAGFFSNDWDLKNHDYYLK